MPTVFLTQGARSNKAFINRARPAVRRWVEEKYHMWRLTCPPRPAPNPLNGYDLRPGWGLAYHLFGDYEAHIAPGGDAFMRLRAIDPWTLGGARPAGIAEDYPGQNGVPAVPGQIMQQYELDIDWLTTYSDLRNDPTNDAHVAIRNLGGPHAEVANALQADLNANGQSRYFLLPSLATLLVDNVRYGYATPQQLLGQMGSSIGGFSGNQPNRTREAGRPTEAPVFNLMMAGANIEYSFLNQLHNLFTAHPRFAAIAASVGGGMNAGTFGARLGPARARMRQRDDIGNLQRLNQQRTLNQVFTEYLRPLLNVLGYRYRLNQVVMVSSNRGAFTSRPAAVRNGTWTVTGYFGSGNNQQFELTPAGGGATFRALGREIYIPTGTPDLGMTAGQYDEEALALLELFAECFMFYDTYCEIRLQERNRNFNIFTNDVPANSDSPPPRGSIAETLNRNDPKPWFDYFIDARTDMHLAFFANMYDKSNAAVKSSLDKMLNGEKFVTQNIAWMSSIVGRHMQPVFVAARQRGRRGERATGVSRPTGFAMPRASGETELVLESPLLRDAFTSFVTRFNDWFSQMLTLTSSGLLSIHPRGAPGGHRNQNQQQQRRGAESMVKEAFDVATKDLLAAIESSEDEAVAVEAVQNALANLGGAARMGNFRAPLPPSISPRDTSSLRALIDSVKSDYSTNPEIIAAVSTAASQMRINRMVGITELEKALMSEIARYSKLSFGDFKFHAGAEILLVLRNYLVIPDTQLLDSVATMMTAAQQADVTARTRAGAGAFLQTPEGQAGQGVALQ